MKNSIHDIYDNVIIAENFSIDFNNWMSVHSENTADCSLCRVY